MMEKTCSAGEPKMRGFSLPNRCFCCGLGHLVEIMLSLLELTGSYGLLGSQLKDLWLGIDLVVYFTTSRAADADIRIDIGSRFVRQKSIYEIVQLTICSDENSIHTFHRDEGSSHVDVIVTQQSIARAANRRSPRILMLSKDYNITCVSSPNSRPYLDHPTDLVAKQVARMVDCAWLTVRIWC